MALFSELQNATVSRPAAGLPVRQVLDAAIRPAGALYRAWRRWRTERILSALPTEVLKDIGYPSAGNE